MTDEKDTVLEEAVPETAVEEEKAEPSAEATVEEASTSEVTPEATEKPKKKSKEPKEKQPKEKKLSKKKQRELEHLQEITAPTTEYAIECENLVKIYKTEQIEVVALQGLDLKVKRGELVAIVGTSGSGKSTLLNMLGGLDKPSAGTLLVNGRNLLKFSEEDYIDYKRNMVGFVWQNNARNLVPYLTAEQNVELPMLLQGQKNRRDRALELLDAVGLSHRINSRLDQMSGGEQQRVAIAISLANNPQILLADEPTGSVDTKTSDQLLQVFKDLNRTRGITIVIVTHDMRLAKQIDRVISIRDGRTSSEIIKKTHAEILQEAQAREDAEEAVAKSVVEGEPDFISEELVVLDRTGRLQLPKEYMEELGMKGGDRVKADLDKEAERIYIRKAE
ncbi:MAG: ATP-binding cassette domain-containing protein [Oscillospiraceae bacterium]|nr:ATP-binding cassette domain-containing protein [Ruminococcus sp.]MCD8345080.1 ATP-binding cassette domain-containing protein [Oscillospiraceae bacterium]